MPARIESAVLERQFSLQMTIDGAIDALFLLRNYVAAHLLASSAHSVIKGLCTEKNNSLVIEKSREFGSSIGISEKDYFRAQNATFNYLKHADFDPKGKMILSTEQTIIFIGVCCFEFQGIFSTISMKMSFFLKFFLSRNYERFEEIDIVRDAKLERGDGDLDKATENYFDFTMNLSDLYERRNEMGLADALF